ERQLPKRRHRRLLVPLDPDRPEKTVQVDPFQPLRHNHRLLTRPVSPRRRRVALHALENARFSPSRQNQTAVSRLIHSRVTSMLLNPSYAGVYVFGRYQSSKEVGPTGEITVKSRRTPQEAWRVMIPDHHQGYIDGDQFTANGARLSANRTNAEVLSGPAREGLCLLQGMLVCGTCGRRVSVRYTGNGGVYPTMNAPPGVETGSKAAICICPLDRSTACSPSGWP